MRPLRLCLGLLTVLPVGAPSEVDRRTAGRAMVLAPVAGLLLGGLTAAVAVAPLPDLVRGALVVAVLAAGSRALHLDGLADTADGLGSARPRDDALEVMRRGDIGPFGVVTLVLVLLVQAASAAAVLSRPGGATAVVVLVVVSRAVLPLLCHRLPPARPDGLGRLVARSVGVLGLLAATALTVVIAGLLLLADPDVGWWHVAAAVAVALVAALLLAAHCVRRFGGVTGDVLGACVEVALTAGLVVLAAG